MLTDLRPCGYLPDAPDARDYIFRDHDPCSASAYGYASMEDYRPPYFYQTLAPSCVAMSMMKVLYMAERAHGNAAPVQASVSHLFYLGRKGAQVNLDPGQRSTPPMTGIYPRDMFSQVHLAGYIPERDWAYDETRLDIPPSAIDTDFTAYGQRGLKYYRIDDHGDARLDEVNRALALGYPVMFGMRVDRAFMAHRGEAAIQAIDPAATARHMMVVLAMRESDVVCVNHWREHGYAGDLVNISHDVFAGPMVDDVYAIAALPQRDQR